MAFPPDSNSQDCVPRPDHAIEQLKIANYYLRVALDQVPHGVVILESQPLVGAGHRVIFSNTPASSMTGADPAKGWAAYQALMSQEPQSSDPGGS